MPDVTRRQLLGASIAAAAAAPALAQGAPSTAGRSLDLKGRSILITGTSSGFGNLAATLFARSGAKVFATMRGLPRAEGEALRKLARDERLDLTVLELDVTRPEQVTAAVAEAERLTGGGLDVVVNNAGIGVSGPVELQDAEAMALMFDTNVHGAHRVARAALPGMRRRKAGLVVQVSSQLGRMVVPNLGAYSATKFALEALSEQMAYELAPRGIEVCIIQPGGYPTQIWGSGARRTEALLARTEQARKEGYPELMGNAVRTGGGSTDPMDVPRAIGEVIAMAPGTRPLRRAVHPGPRPQEPINRVSAEVQRQVLGRGPYAPWAEAVLG
jgi:NAD(P)-dependent dehydrogenase (short-subunit alcohol dehydrogenase family)